MVTVEQKLKYVLRDNEPDFKDFVEGLLKSERLEGQAVIGIAKLIVSDEHLSDKQIETFIEYGLLKDNYLEECPVCLDSVPWSEMLYALDDGHCSHCEHLLEGN